MRRSILAVLFLLMAAPCTAQRSIAAAGPSRPADPLGAWTGSLVGPAGILPVVFRVASQGGTLAAALDVPGRDLFDQPVRVRVVRDSVLFDVPRLGAGFRGVRNRAGDVLEGTWSQGDARLPLYLRRTSNDAVRRRAQEPVGPRPYIEQDITFASAAPGGLLAGTLALPAGRGPFPAVILIAGSGAHDRDATVAGHRPFLVLADHLVRSGVAVLRFDERGVGASTGTFRDATTLDHADDVRGAVRVLLEQREVDAARIGLVGHSEGGVIAPMVAADESDVAFLVLLAAPGVPLRSVALRQAADMTRAEGMSEAWVAEHRAMLQDIFAVMDEESDPQRIMQRARPILEAAHAHSPYPTVVRTRQIEAALETYAQPWMRFALQHDPAVVLRRVTVPVLALSGSLDTQVCAGTNLPAIAAALADAGNTRVTWRTLPALNHYFQTSRTGGPSEYARIEETFAPVAMTSISEWIAGLYRTR